jgi:hypothetical protein
LQDSWALSDRVTVNVGLRAGRYRGHVPTRDRAFSASSYSPRAGVAWDPFRDRRTVVRAHYGRYHDTMVTSFYDFLDPRSQTEEIEARVIGPDQFVEETRFASTLNASVDEGIRYPYVDEISAGAERQLSAGIAVRAQVIRRDFADSIGFIDRGSLWNPIVRTDPGPDAVLGTADDGGPLTVFSRSNTRAAQLHLTNPPAYRRYRAVQFTAVKRYAGNMAFQGSYTWSRLVGNYNNLFASNAAGGDLGTNGTFVNPNRRINTEGRTPQDFTHEFKVLATAHLPVWNGFQLSAVYRYQSGRTWARSVAFGQQTLSSVFVEPRATRQLPNTNVLDLRVEKMWRPGARLGTLGVFGEVFNVTNQGIALRVLNASGPNLGLPMQWSSPRVLQAGLRYRF